MPETIFYASGYARETLMTRYGRAAVRVHPLRVVNRSDVPPEAADWPALAHEQHSARLMRGPLDDGVHPDPVLHHVDAQIGSDEPARLDAGLRRLSKVRAGQP